MKRKVYIINKPALSRYSVPILWTSAKTYFEENSKYADDWFWIPPEIRFDQVDQVVDSIVYENPAVVGVSVYIWNEIFSHKIAAEIKRRLPNTVIIFGGPQSDIKFNSEYFRQYPYIDLVVPSDAYGEVSFFNILENISQNNTFVADKVDYAFYPDQKRNVMFNEIQPKKKDFNWPKNPYKSQQDYLLPIIEESNNNHETLWLTMETSRGCPYKCSFCDWGGGTYTKTVKKPFSYVLDELTWAGQNKIHAIYITDANFGMFDIDVEYTKHAVNVAKEYGYPKQIFVQPTKVKLQNLFKIYKMLAEADLLSHYQISIQDLDDDVKKNIDRIDFSFEEQVEMFEKLQSIKYLPVFIECILGLPGSSIDTIKKSIHRISLKKLPFPVGHHWILLPATPAYDPEYREKFKLQTIKGKSSNGIGVTSAIKQKENQQIDVGVNSTRTTADDISTEYVIGTFSYTPNDWINMNLLQVFVASVQTTEILDLVADYMWNEYNVEYGEFFHSCLNTILYDQRVSVNFKNDMEKLSETLNDWLNGKRIDVYCDYDSDFAFELSPVVHYIFVILTHKKEFFDSIRFSLESLVSTDDKLNDLINYSEQRLIDITYTPGKIISSKYDWSKYKQHNIVTLNPKRYKLNDVQLFAGGRWFDIDWDQYKGSKNYYTHFIYRACYDIKSAKIARNITELDE